MSDLKDVFSYDSKLDRLIWANPPSNLKRASWLKGRPAGTYKRSNGGRHYYLIFGSKRYGTRELKTIFTEATFK